MAEKQVTEKQPDRTVVGRLVNFFRPSRRGQGPAHLENELTIYERWQKMNAKAIDASTPSKQEEVILPEENEELQKIKMLSLDDLRTLDAETLQEYAYLLEKEMQYFRSMTESQREYVIDKFKKNRMYVEMIKTALDGLQPEKKENKYSETVDSLLAGVSTVVEKYANKTENEMQAIASGNLSRFKDEIKLLREIRSTLHELTRNKIPYQRESIKNLRRTVEKMEEIVRFIER